MTQRRAVIYARYSSDLQREASIEDQVRECKGFANQMGWNVAAVFSDAAISGSIEARPGLQALLSAVRAGSAERPPFCAESRHTIKNSRLKRAARDVAGVLTFEQVDLTHRRQLLI